jgi:peptidylprolyl isomerase
MYRIRKILTRAPAIIFPWFCLAAAAPTMTSLLAASKPADWRATDPQNALYLDLPAGRVVIELAPAFAPMHVENITHHGIWTAMSPWSDGC